MNKHLGGLIIQVDSFAEWRSLLFLFSLVTILTVISWLQLNSSLQKICDFHGSENSDCLPGSDTMLLGKLVPVS